MRIMAFSLWAMVLREGEGAGAGGAAGGGDPGGAGAAGGAGAGAGAGGAGGGDPGAGGGAADPYWRDFLPADIKADKPEERFDRLANSWKSQRDQIASRPAAPKTAAEYAFEPSDKVKPYFPDPAKDPILGIAREAALEVGLPKDAFGKFVGKIYETAIEKGLLAAPYDPMAEGQKIAERIAPGKAWAEAKPMVAAAVKDAESFAGVLADQLKLGDGAKGLLTGLSDDAAGVELLQALSGAMGKDPAFKVGGTAASASGWTKDSLDAAVKDPRYNPYDRAYDKDFRAKVDAGFKQVHGEGFVG